MVDTELSHAPAAGQQTSSAEPPQPSVQLDADRQAEARRYAQLKQYLFLADLGVGAVYLLVALFSGFSGWLKAWALGLTGWPFLVIAIYTLVFFLIYSVVVTPLNVLGGYILPHRFGLSRQHLRSWAWDQVKSIFLGLALAFALVEVLYWLVRISPSVWWLWMGLFYLLFVIVLTNLAPLIFVPVFYKLQPLDDPNLVDRLTALARRAETRVRGVFTMNLSAKTTMANAALMGLGNTRRIVLGDTMLQDYSPDEIETVLAHELGHHVHGDIWKGILVSSTLVLIGLYLCHQGLLWAVSRLGFEGLSDIAVFPLLGLGLGLFAVLTMPLGNLYMRWREQMADDYAVKMTGRPEAFIAAMTRLANQNLAESDPAPWVEFLLYDHPSIGRRIRRAAAFGNSDSP
jgi:STE24 endopeptidase